MPPEAAPEVETPWSGGGAQNPKTNVTFLMSRKYVSKQETGAKSETARHSRKLFVAVSRSVTPLETPGR